jgi:hypothetical protein
MKLKERKKPFECEFSNKRTLPRISFNKILRKFISVTK